MTKLCRPGTTDLQRRGVLAHGGGVSARLGDIDHGRRQFALQATGERDQTNTIRANTGHTLSASSSHPYQDHNETNGDQHSAFAVAIVRALEQGSNTGGTCKTPVSHLQR